MSMVDYEWTEKKKKDNGKEYNSRKDQFSKRNLAEANCKSQSEKDRIIIVYRSNDVYDKLVEQLSGGLKERGRDIEIIAFPKEMTEEAIKVFLEKHSDKLRSSNIICDKTIERQISSISSTPTIVIDDVCQRATASFCEEKLPRKNVGSSYEAAYKGLLELAFSTDLIQKPRKIYICPDRLRDHYSLSATDMEVAQKVAKWTEEFGIEAEITSFPKKDPRTWILIDRHSHPPQASTQDQPVLRLPPETLYSDLSDIAASFAGDEIIKRAKEQIVSLFKAESREGKVDRVSIEFNKEEKKRVIDESFPREAKEYVKSVAPHLGCDFTEEPVLPKTRKDVGVVRHMAENGYSYGYDTIYFVWRGKEGKIHAKELTNSASTKDYIFIEEVSETENEFIVRVRYSGGFDGQPWAESIRVSKKEIAEWKDSEHKNDQAMINDRDKISFSGYAKGFASEAKYFSLRYQEAAKYLHVMNEQLMRLSQASSGEKQTGEILLENLHKDAMEKLIRKHQKASDEIKIRLPIIAEVYGEQLTKETINLLAEIEEAEVVRAAAHILGEMAILRNSSEIYARFLSLLKKNIKNTEVLSRILEDSRFEFKDDKYIEEGMKDYE